MDDRRKAYLKRKIQRHRRAIAFDIATIAQILFVVAAMIDGMFFRREDLAPVRNLIINSVGLFLLLESRRRIVR